MPPKSAGALLLPPLRTMVQPEVGVEPLKQNAKPRLRAESRAVGRLRSGMRRPCGNCAEAGCQSGIEWTALAPPPLAYAASAGLVGDHAARSGALGELKALAATAPFQRVEATAVTG